MDTWWVLTDESEHSNLQECISAVVKAVDVEALERRVKWLEEGQQLIAVGRADGSIGYGVALGWSEKCDDWLSREPKE